MPNAKLPNDQDLKKMVRRYTLQLQLPLRECNMLYHRHCQIPVAPQGAVAAVATAPPASSRGPGRLDVCAKQCRTVTWARPRPHIITKQTRLYIVMIALASSQHSNVRSFQKFRH